MKSKCGALVKIISQIAQKLMDISGKASIIEKVSIPPRAWVCRAPDPACGFEFENRFVPRERRAHCPRWPFARIKMVVLLSSGDEEWVGGLGD